MERISGEEKPHMFRDERNRHVRDSTARALQAPPEHHSAPLSPPAPRCRWHSTAAAGSPAWGRHRPGGDTRGRRHEGTPPAPPPPAGTIRKPRKWRPGAAGFKHPEAAQAGAGRSRRRAVSRAVTRGLAAPPSPAGARKARAACARLQLSGALSCSLEGIAVP